MAISETSILSVKASIVCVGVIYTAFYTAVDECETTCVVSWSAAVADGERPGQLNQRQQRPTESHRHPITILPSSAYRRLTQLEMRGIKNGRSV